MVAILAAAYTFTAVATGIEKGAPVEFFFAGNGSDRDYETMFLLEKPVGEICTELDKAGLKTGLPPEADKCNLWPVGCPVQFDPPISQFIDSKLPNGMTCDTIIYTGGARNEKGGVIASTTMPLSMFSLYTLSQSPFQFNGIYHQGVVYNSHTAKTKLKKGDKVQFTVSWDISKAPKCIDLEFKPGNMMDGLKQLKEASAVGEISVKAGFSSQLTVSEASAVAKSLATIDSVRVKLNGRYDGDFFYRSFLPPVKWRDRSQRLLQPFEFHLDGNSEKLVFIEEDWSGEGSDPRLIPHEIAMTDVAKHPKTDTCFIFCKGDVTIGVLKSILKRFPVSVKNWYVFEN